MTAFRYVGFAVLLLPLACGGPKEAEQPAAVPPPPAAAPGEAPLTPIAAPADVFAIARLRAPGQVVDSATRWAGFPFDWRTLLAKEMPGAERVLAFDAPLDAVVMLDPAMSMEPKFLAAFSVGVTSVDGTLAFFREQGRGARVAQNRVRLGKLSCSVERALGVAPARLVCGSDAEVVDALAPYLTRGLPSENFGDADIHAHVDFEPLRRRFGPQLTLIKTAGVPFAVKELAVDHPAFDKPLRDALYAGADELIDIVHDAGRLAVDATLDDSRELVSLVLSADMVGKKSWFAGSVAASAAQSAGPPDDFWRLPSAVTSANYTVYNDPARMERPAQFMTALVSGWLEYMGLAAQKRAALADALRQVLVGGGGTVYAELPVTLATDKANKKLTEVERGKEGVRYALGEHVYLVQDPAGRYTAFLDAASAALADRAFRSGLDAKDLFPSKALPSVRKRAPRGAKGLPKESVVYDIEVSLDALGDLAKPAKLKEMAPAKPGKKRPPLRGVVLVVPEGERTWLLIGADEAKLYEQLTAIRTPANGETLASREGLTTLKASKAISGGFTTLRGIATDLSSSLPDAEQPAELFDDAQSLNRVLASLPYQGMAPLPYTVTASPDGPTLKAMLLVPKAVVQDVAAGAAAGLARRMKL